MVQINFINAKLNTSYYCVFPFLKLLTGEVKLHSKEACPLIFFLKDEAGAHSCPHLYVHDTQCVEVASI